MLKMGTLVGPNLYTLSIYHDPKYALFLSSSFFRTMIETFLRIKLQIHAYGVHELDLLLQLFIKIDTSHNSLQIMKEIEQDKYIFSF